MKYIWKLVICALVVISSMIRIDAAGASISGGGNVNIGDIIKVTINTGNSKSWAYSVTYPSNLELLSGDVEPMGFEGNNPVNTLQFKAVEAGNGSVSFSGQVSDGTKDINIGGSVAVSVTKEQPQTPTPPSTPNKPSNGGGSNQPTPPAAPSETDKRSTDNTLSSLATSTGELSPAFSSATTSYTVSLPAEAETITIDAKAADGKATVTGVGEKSVKAGKNEFIIVVTAENGATKEYVVHVIVDEKPLVYTELGNKKLGFVRNLADVKAPENFVETTSKFEGKDVSAWINEKINKTIVYLSDEQNEKGFYLLEDGKITSSFTYRKLLGREFYIVEIPTDKQKIAGMSYQQLTIDETPLMGWVFDDKAFENYQVIYVMDMEGNMQYYQYEITQNTLQLNSQGAAITQAAYEKERESANTTKYLLITSTAIAAVIAAASLGYLGYSTYRSKKRGSKS